MLYKDDANGTGSERVGKGRDLSLVILSVGTFGNPETADIRVK